jgi:hypothetical protein
MRLHIEWPFNHSVITWVKSMKVSSLILIFNFLQIVGRSLSNAVYRSQILAPPGILVR